MKVRVKPGKTYFYGEKLYKEGEIIDIKERLHSVDLDEKGRPVVITEDQQFSSICMEKVKGRPAVKEKDES